jgi:hypothetical protein
MYVLCQVDLVRRALLSIQIISQTNIILIAAEVLGFFVRQCVLSFRSYLQYGFMLLLSHEASTLL